MCHNGPADDTFANMEEAHTGIVRDPSTAGEVGCANCHDEQFGVTTACEHCHPLITASAANSLHTNLWGEKALIEKRGDCTFDGSDFEDKFTNKCGGCHTTCGQCHVSRPNSVGGGFPKFGGISYSAHRFNKTPNQTENCTACHGSRVGTDYTGALEGNEPDFHSTSPLRYNCSGCHSGEEMHGDGQHEGEHYTHRYQVESMPRCETCHPSLSENDYHNAHADGYFANLQCQVCHSQPYKNCTNCHDLDSTSKSDKYVIDPSVIQFKIGVNPSPYRQEYDYAVVRHVPVDPGTYDDWGLDLPAYDTEPTWKYASPHNVIKNTAQTTVEDGQSCSFSCHGNADNPSPYLLREADLYLDGSQLPDYNANIDFVIDDAFPSTEDNK